MQKREADHSIYHQASGAWMRIPFAILFLCVGFNALAHPGHADPVTISRQTVDYIQQIVPPYLQLQNGLAAGRLDDEVVAGARQLHQLAAEARDKEKDRSGKKMYRLVAAQAESLTSATDLAGARETFAALNDELLPFFDSWPAHLERNGLVMYVCTASEQWWMQKAGPPAIPYAGGAEACGDLVNTKQEEE